MTFEFGISDTPTDTDDLGVGMYFEGLAEFIRACPTPMTVAVQGAWGSGKTSAMKIVERMLDNPGPGTPKDSIKSVWVSTWQYDQFSLGDTLSLSLISAINDKLAGGDGTKSAAFRDSLKRILVSAGFGLAVGGARVFAPVLENVAESTAAAFKETLAAAESNRDAAAEIAELREKFAEVVKATKRRVVVFVDDLDRLRPQRAVEVMEAIKLFLDVSDCVFVLAIDFDVVSLGVSQKYGSDVDPRKARDFFDKIIQVPFQMPVAAYDLEMIFTSGLATSHASSQGHANDLIDIARAAVSTNPRATKRLLNTFLLLRSVLAKQDLTDGTDRPTDEQLFAVLSLQAAYPDVYAALANELARTADAGGAKSPLPTGGTDFPEGWRVRPEEASGIRSLLEIVNATFLRGKNFCHAEFRAAMGSAAVTASGTSPVAQTGRTIRGSNERRHRLRTLGVAEPLITLAGTLEDELTQCGFTIGGYTSKTWSIYLPPSEDGSHSQRIAAQVRFSGRGLQVDFCSSSYVADVETVALRLLDRAQREIPVTAAGLPKTTHEAEQRLRLRTTGLTEVQQISALAPILIELLAASGLETERHQQTS